MTRRFGETPKTGIRYRRRPGAYAILPRAGRILLTHQAFPEPEMQLPGGGVDPGESPLRALYREVLEETGWSIARPRRLGAFRRFVFMPEYDMWAEKLCMIYLAFPVRQLGAASEKGHTPVWSDPETAAKLVGNPGDRHFVSRYLRAVRWQPGWV